MLVIEIPVEFVPCAGQDCPDCNPKKANEKAAALEGYAANAVKAEEDLKRWEDELHKVTPAVYDKKPGNREREAMFRAVIAVEKALAKLPQAHAQVAGYLQAFGLKGGKSGENNALVLWLAQRLLSGAGDSVALVDEITKVNVFVEANGIILETAKYQMALDPAPWQEMFMIRLRQGDFPNLLS